MVHRLFSKSKWIYYTLTAYNQFHTSLETGLMRKLRGVVVCSQPGPACPLMPVPRGVQPREAPHPSRSTSSLMRWTRSRSRKRDWLDMQACLTLLLEALVMRSRGKEWAIFKFASMHRKKKISPSQSSNDPSILENVIAVPLLYIMRVTLSVKQQDENKGEGSWEEAGLEVSPWKESTFYMMPASPSLGNGIAWLHKVDFHREGDPDLRWSFRRLQASPRRLLWLLFINRKGLGHWTWIMESQYIKKELYKGWF